MSMVTNGAETWTAHTHRHHAGGTAWIFGPEGPSMSTGTYPVTAQTLIGTAEFLFWNAAGTQSGGAAYPVGELTPVPAPVFPAGTDPGSVIAWYIQTGNGNGPPGLIFDALLETEGNWIDWDATNDPFTVTSGTRGAQPDNDDTAYSDAGEAAVSAHQVFPGTGLVFDKWLVFGEHTHLSPTDRWQVTQDEGTSGYAFAIYRQPSGRVPPWVAEGPVRWFDMGDPAPRVQESLRQQSELSQITSLIDYSSVVSDQRARALLQRGMYETLIAIAQRHLNAGNKVNTGSEAGG